MEIGTPLGALGNDTARYLPDFDLVAPEGNSFSTLVEIETPLGALGNDTVRYLPDFDLVAPEGNSFSTLVEIDTLQDCSVSKHLQKPLSFGKVAFCYTNAFCGRVQSKKAVSKRIYAVPAENAS